MERLTIDTKILFCDIAQCRETPGGSFCENGYCDQRRVYERLREYERFSERWKLGIEQMDTIFGRINALGGMDLMAQYRALGTIGDLTALVKARDEGRFVALPCKVGTPIWYIDVSIEPSERGSSKWTTRKRVKATKFDYSVLDWIDTPIYLTRAEAEAALKGSVDNEAN